MQEKVYEHYYQCKCGHAFKIVCSAHTCERCKTKYTFQFKNNLIDLIIQQSPEYMNVLTKK